MIMKIGKFTVQANLGTGAHSSILQVRRAEDSRTYALKVVNIDEPEDMKFLKQSEHEFAILQKLAHPNIIKAHALETEKAWMFGKVTKVHLLMEFVNGKTMDSARLTLPQKVQAFRLISEALVHMHRRDVLHGDLKPGNVMVGKQGVLKVIDFGLAHTRGDVRDRITGTPEYIAPETVKSKILSERTDLYNFGALMYRSLSNKALQPWINEAGELIEAKVWNKYYKPIEEILPGLAPELCSLVGQCLQADVRNRPERASDAQNVLSVVEERLVTSPEKGLDGLE
ncbi:MAG: serine/threonine protein kinase [Planctomycetota bacterium]|nr:MAG: serine/threonine protein kinase [Planctomycetota bacterium]